MKAYVVTTGIVFGLLTLAHIARIAAEGIHVAANPWFVGSTLLAAALSIWSWRALRRMARP